ncbi:hypothetical protein M9H77_10483 [Catharanthus roseus]|uniref:Uncharacterized protein n=1 Tax=Catharanthus roseus TaxID=4058 RepID=A0ACC0BBY0_CATRO|nr:hypothetical protein M9H77_10483 [Catharanthus roseus]
MVIILPILKMLKWDLKSSDGFSRRSSLNENDEPAKEQAGTRWRLPSATWFTHLQTIQEGENAEAIAVIKRNREQAHLTTTTQVRGESPYGRSLVGFGAVELVQEPRFESWQRQCRNFTLSNVGGGRVTTIYILHLGVEQSGGGFESEGFAFWSKNGIKED